MNNSSASESMEIASQVSTTQNTSGIATSERNYDQTVQDIENQNMQVAAEVEPLIVIGTSFNQQQHPVQDIENPNLEEFDGAPPNFVQQQHTVEDNDPNQNREEQSGEGINNSGASESTEITSHVSNTQHAKGVATIERNYDHTVQDIENQNMQDVSVEVDPPIVIGTSFKQQHDSVEDIENPNLEEAPPNFVQQQQHTVQDNDGNQNWEGVAPASPSLILQLPDTIQDDGSQTSEPNTIEDNGSQTSEPNTIQDNGSQTSEPNTIQDDGSQTSEAPTNFDQQQHTVRDNDRNGEGEELDLDLMYRAAEEGDWATAYKLLNKDPTLAYRQDRRGYRPLHVSVASKHHKFALKLIERMEASDLALEDSNLLTACSYAAASGSLDIARAMIKKNPTVVHNSPEVLFSAFLSGKSEVVLFFLERTPVEFWWQKEDLLEALQRAIESKMIDVALTILEKDGSLATMCNEKGTALHVLARQDISAATTGKTAMIFKSIFGTTLIEIKTMVTWFVWKIYNKFNNKDVNIYDSGRQGQGEMPKDFHSLAEKLLDEIQKLKDKRRELKLLNNPPILHDAAKVENMELIFMLTDLYPDLIRQKDYNGQSLITVAIMYRKTNMISFIRRLSALDTSWKKKDVYDNNLLHLAAILVLGKNVIPCLQMQSELAWFKAMEAILPPEMMEERNRNGMTPREVFMEQHWELRKESRAWMKSTADSCMLIATIILTVVYAAAFTVPGGNNEETGLPILVKSNWLTCFFIFEALALFSSTLCIITFWSITCSGFEEDEFFDILRYQLRLGFTALFCSLIGATTAFLSAYHMMLVDGKAWFVKSILILIYGILVLAICGRFIELWFKTKLPKSWPPMISSACRLYTRRLGDENTKIQD